MFIRKIFAILIVFTCVSVSSSASAASRKGFFGRTSFGLGHYTSTQTWEYETRTSGAIWDTEIADSGRVKNVVSQLYPSFNIGAGIGLTDRILFSFDLKLSKFAIGVFNATVFYSESAPSLFADLTFPFATSGRIKFLDDYSENFLGKGYSFGLGYEFTKSICVRVGFNRTFHVFETSDSDYAVGLVTFGLVDPGGTDYVGMANAVSFDISLVLLIY